MKKILSISIIIFISASVFAHGETVKSFSLKEAIDYAIQNNNTVKNARLDQAKAKAFNWEILTTGLPQINAGADYTYYYKVPQVPAIAKLFSDPNSFFNKMLNQLAVNDPNGIGKIIQENAGSNTNVSFVLQNNISTNLQVTQLLFDGRYVVGLKARKDLYKTSRLSTELSEQEIRYTITKAYYQAEAAQEAKGLLQENVQILDKLLSDTRAVFEQGLGEELDVNRLELVKATLESQINLQNRMAEVGLANLKFQMGLPLGDEIILTDKLNSLKAGANLSAVTPFDHTKRIEYDMLNTGVIVRGYDVARRKGGYYPTLAAFFNYGWNVQTEKFNEMFKRETIAGKKISPWYSQGLVGLKLSLPIFDSGLTGAQVKQAKLEQMKTKNDLNNFKNAALLQYQSAESSFKSALSDEAISQKTLDLSKKIFTKNQIKFKEGVGSSFELSQSEQEYTANQLKYIQSVMNLLNAKADLDKAVGVR